MTKHTPGPWVTTEWPKPNIDGPYLKIGIKHKSEVCDGGEHCTVEAGHITPEADATARANARLIAAAPELLAVAVRIVGAAISPPKDQKRKLQEVAELARAAIAKARGE